MGAEEDGWGGWPPAPGGAPLYIQKDDHWTHFDNSVNAVSFGFVATAILISMFLVMAIFEKFLRTTSPPLSPADGRRRLHSDIEAQAQIAGFNAKLGYPSPKAHVMVHRECRERGRDIFRKNENRELVKNSLVPTSINGRSEANN